MSESNIQRVIAIVGRPNVGKSALFNRLVGKRVAIVHEESGVTRDRLSCEALWDDQCFELIDTGGVGMMDGTESGDAIIDGTRKQVDLAIQDAAVVLFVVDITSGVAPLDQDVARLLHQSGRCVFVAANKADNDRLEPAAVEFESLGFPVVPISALHNRGVDELMTEALAELPPVSEEGKKKSLKIAVVGRPNVGKSSYVNRLLRNERVIVSEIPGTTRDSIEVPFEVGNGPQARHYLLIDTAGMRKSRKSEAIEKFSILRAERSIRRADVVIHMLDAEQGPTSQDKKIAAMIMEERKGSFLLVNKWDLAQEGDDGDTITQRAYGVALRKALPFLTYVPIIFTSAKSGYNIRKTVEAVDYVSAQVHAQLTTGLLNRVLRDAMARVQPPVVQGRRLKIYYATQVGVQPVTVRLFVNSPRRLKPAYKSYLVRSLREAFGLEGAPIVLQFRERSRTEKN